MVPFDIIQVIKYDRNPKKIGEYSKQNLITERTKTKRLIRMNQCTMKTSAINWKALGNEYILS